MKPVRRPKGYRTIVVDGSIFFWLMTLDRCGCCCDDHCTCGRGLGLQTSGKLFVIKAGNPGKLEVTIHRRHRESVKAAMIPSSWRQEAAQLRIIEEIMLL